MAEPPRPPESPVSPGRTCGCRVLGCEEHADILARWVLCRAPGCRLDPCPLHAAAAETALNLAELERNWDALQARVVEVEAERNALRERLVEETAMRLMFQGDADGCRKSEGYEPTTWDDWTTEGKWNWREKARAALARAEKGGGA